MAAEIMRLEDMFKNVSDELTKTVNQPNAYGYKPYPKQLEFHSTDTFGRLLLGGNRAGKTDANVMECIWQASNTHPYRDNHDGPIQGRCIAVDVEKGINQILIPKFKRWMPSDMLEYGSWERSYDVRGKVLHFSNGSTIDFLTYEMDMDKHGGVPRHFLSFDEEPPQHIFNEGMQRLIDYDGNWFASLTPLQGLSWMHEKIYEPAQNDPTFTDIAVFEAATDENPYLKAKNFDKFSFAMDEAEKESRYKGKFTAMSGLIFPEFARQYRDADDNVKQTHIIPSMAFQLPSNWEFYMSMDEGWNNPTAVLWHAVSPDNTIVTFSEHYASGMTLREHAQVIHAREAAMGRIPDVRTGDPAMKQTSSQTGMSKSQMLSEYGIDLALDRVPRDVETGIARMQQYFRINPKTNQPKWFITDNCVNFIREMKGLRWATYSSRKMQFEQNKQETVHKKNDHTFDSARYFATFMPDLTPAEQDRPPVLPGASLPGESYDTMLARQVRDPDIEVMWDQDNESSSGWETTESYDQLYG